VLTGSARDLQADIYADSFELLEKTICQLDDCQFSHSDLLSSISLSLLHITMRKALGAGWLSLERLRDERPCSLGSITIRVRRLSPECTQLLMLWISPALALELKPTELEANHLQPSSAEVKNSWSCTSTYVYVFVTKFVVKHRAKFIEQDTILNQEMHFCYFSTVLPIRI
jgi:hypothetical protein